MIKAIHLFVPGPFGGAEQVILAGLEKLKETVDVELWIVKESRAPKHANYFIEETLKKNISHQIFEAKGILDFNLIRELKDQIPHGSIYHAHALKASFYAYLSKGETPLVVTHHGDTSHTLKVRIYEMIQRYIMRRSRLVIAVSNQMKIDLEKYNIKSTVVENLLSVNTLSSPTERIDKLTSLIVVGRLSPEKGIDVLIRSLQGVENIKLDIVGAGAQEQVLKDLVLSTKQNDKIFFRGFQKDIVNIISSSDCLIMPSLREGLPMTLIETICLGKPVIGSHVGAIGELVTTNGLTVPPGNSELLKKAIRTFLQNKSIYTQKAQEKKLDFQKRFSVESWCENTKVNYKKVLNQS